MADDNQTDVTSLTAPSICEYCGFLTFSHDVVSPSL
jgi:hypothetical protein